MPGGAFTAKLCGVGLDLQDDVSVFENLKYILRTLACFFLL